MSMGNALSEQMAQKVGEIKQAVAGISDEQASKPKGEEEWCVKEVLSHLCGDTDALSMYEFKRFLEEENPELGIVPGRLGDPPESGAAVRASFSRRVGLRGDRAVPGGTVR